MLLSNVFAMIAAARQGGTGVSPVRRMRVICMLCIIAAGAQPAPADATHQATGVKIGEVTPTSAIIWTRLTRDSARREDGVPRAGRPARPLGDELTVEDLEGACPGMAGRIRVRYGTRQNLADAPTTEWVTVGAETDYTHQFVLENLQPATIHYFAVETTDLEGHPHAPLSGSFRTAPPPDRNVPVTFTVMTCQEYSRQDIPDGFAIYPSMAARKPDFLVATGDNVYYDNFDPVATSVAVARYHWDRIYSLPSLVEFHRHFPTYWEKDDHDTLWDDCWPGKRPEGAGSFTYEQGRQIFLEEVPMGAKTYRTFRWGKRLQIWLVEGRDYRSPNTDPGGPEKTIWGADQKRWLTETLLASDADWKILISPTPIVGPDRPNKADNHSNRAFAHEGSAFRKWVQQNLPDNFFVINGDRHWQYHSVHPTTGVHEFACGPASDEHASGSPGYDPNYHRFHRVEGGFLSVSVEPIAPPPPDGPASRITFRHHDVAGEVVYTYSPN